jgi:hypothetical protein
VLPAEQQQQQTRVQVVVQEAQTAVTVAMELFM